MKKSFMITGLAALIVLTAMSCVTVDKVGNLATSVGESVGIISGRQAESIRKSSAAVSKTLEDFSPKQEYYIGRAVGAVVLSRYPVYPHDGVTRYINILGQTLAAASDKPEIYGGYHFLVLDSDDINAFATPGGHIFITRGLIRCCPSEDALAAVLAHEIGHVQLRHGMQSIEKARVTEALMILAREGAENLGPRELANLSENFSGVISDIVNSMINNGYSRAFEYQADHEAVRLSQRIGYNPQGLIDVLKIMDKSLKKGGLDFAKTHPASKNRIKEIQSREKQEFTAVSGPDARRQRFQSAVAGI